MTAQELFDKVVDHLYIQGEPSFLGGTDICAYRGEWGTKCAAGVLIPDDLYDPEMESKGWFHVAHKFKSLEFLDEHKDLIVSLQLAHDATEPERFVRDITFSFATIAKTYGLKFAPRPSMPLEGLILLIQEELISQGKPALSSRGKCVYRGEGGTKCAFGVLIPEELYYPEIEGIPFRHIIEIHEELGYLKDHVPALKHLQAIHDNYVSMVIEEDFPTYIRHEFNKVLQGE